MWTQIQELEATELASWHADTAKGFRLVDVREMPELAGGMIAGAQAIPLATLPLRLAELDRAETVVLVCRSGARSAQACLYLQQQGYDSVYNLRGGMLAWVGTGLPAVAPDQALTSTPIA